jgi:hypothetical protein
LDLFDQAWVQVSDNLALNWVGRFTDATLHFTGDDFSVFPAVPNGIQSI